LEVHAVVLALLEVLPDAVGLPYVEAVGLEFADIHHGLLLLLNTRRRSKGTQAENSGIHD
jgi:hypothetical protein